MRVRIERELSNAIHLLTARRFTPNVGAAAVCVIPARTALTTDPCRCTCVAASDFRASVLVAMRSRTTHYALFGDRASNYGPQLITGHLINGRRRAGALRRPEAVDHL